jgi:hypothetical protein
MTILENRAASPGLDRDLVPVPTVGRAETTS